MAFIGCRDIDRVIQDWQFGIGGLIIRGRDEHEIVRLCKDACVVNDTSNLDMEEKSGVGAGACMHSEAVTNLFVVLINQVLIYDNLAGSEQGRESAIRGSLQRWRRHDRKCSRIHCL